MSGDLERLSMRISTATPSAGTAVLAAELLGRVRAELPDPTGADFACATYPERTRTSRRRQPQALVPRRARPA